MSARRHKLKSRLNGGVFILVWYNIVLGKLTMSKIRHYLDTTCVIIIIHFGFKEIVYLGILLRKSKFSIY